MENEHYIKKWLDGTLTREERQVFEGTEEYQSLEKLSNSLLAFRAPEYDTQAELERLKSREPSKGRVVEFNWLKPLLKVAAVFVGLLGAYFYFISDNTVTVNTLAGEKAEVYLPDSSQVMLNALSSISFNKNKWEKDREVQLEGEAFFDVAHGSRFDVETAMGVITVLGTEFNVKNRRDYFEVICYTGLVQVQAANEIIKIPPKHMFRIINNKVIKNVQITDDSPGWLTDESYFQSVPFYQVVEEFERQYNVAVSRKNVDTTQNFTGSFVHSDMELALKSIAYPLNLSYEIIGDQRIILSGDTE